MAKSLRSLTYKIRNNKLKLSKRFRKKRGGSRKLIRRKKVSKNKKLKRRRRKSKYIGGSFINNCTNFDEKKKKFDIDKFDNEKDKKLYIQINEMIRGKKIILDKDDCIKKKSETECVNTIIFNSDIWDLICEATPQNIELLKTLLGNPSNTTKEYTKCKYEEQNCNPDEDEATEQGTKTNIYLGQLIKEIYGLNNSTGNEKSKTELDNSESLETEAANVKPPDDEKPLVKEAQEAIEKAEVSVKAKVNKIESPS